MTDANPHRIGRQVLELELASAAGAAELQEEAARPLRSGAPEIEALFDRLAGPDEILRVERLEIDLGELRGADWSDQLLARLLERLRRSLEPHAGRTPVGSEAAPAARSSPGGARFEQFLFFLAHGRLPWWGHRPERPWREAAPEPRDAAERRALGELLRADRRARERLVLIVDDGYLAARVAALAGLARSERVMRALTPAVGDGESRQRWRRLFWRRTLEVAVDGPVAAERGVELLTQLLEASASAAAPGETAPRPSGERPGEEAAPAPEPPLPEPWRTWLERAREAAPPAATAGAGAAEVDDAPPATTPADEEPPAARPAEAAAGTPTPEAAMRESGTEAGGTESIPERGAAAPPEGSPAPPAAPAEPPARTEALLRFPEPAAVPSAEIAPGQALYVDGAGVVILHPFVEELFARRGLLDERRFRDEAARRRAVHLLAQLTFGVADLPEYELLVPKLLCAMPWEEPLVPVELDPDDLAACDELLEAVLGHWAALKSASPAWLREQFFLRDGRLETVDDGWKLTVERRAQDVLLTRLPWGVGMIRLPWMQEFLYVSWAE